MVAVFFFIRYSERPRANCRAALMSAAWVCLLPPARRTITVRPHRAKYTRYPGPASIRYSEDALADGRDVARIARCEPFDARLNTRAAMQVPQIIEPSREALRLAQLDHRSRL